VLINTARGAIVDSAALVHSLEQGRLASAALDVVDSEPVIPQALLQSERVLLTPHAAFYAREGIVELRYKAASHLLALIQGRTIRDVVNGVASHLH
jgi:D-3-phosphoglycerate dehydrogenase/C-terminal binding protein